MPDRPLVTDAIVRRLEMQGDFDASHSALQGKSFVYVVEASPLMVKVGFSSDIEERMRNLQTACPYDLTLEFVVPVEHHLAKTVEALAHKALARRRAQGEWFSVEAKMAYAVVKAALASVRAQQAGISKAG